ncbi:hypothetical protein FQN52_005165 [Onygenales sp. PD_12]|nr:hypothetical protein FQN52_005165 [Onygenales sp. PD_12]
MAAHLSNSSAGNEGATGVSLDELPKTNNFTSKLPPDPAFETPESSHNAPRETLGPRLVKGALFTYVRPEPTARPELLSVSPRALKDIGLKEEEEKSPQFREFVSGNKIFWDPEKGGRAISLFETTNQATKTRYEVQLKGAGITPYSRFADGKAVLRSSIREYIVSEALNALGIPTTRALSLVLSRNSKVRRERLEPGAIVTRFAQSWIRIGTFDLLRSRNDRDLIRKLATYVAEDVFPGWESLPAALPVGPDGKTLSSVDTPSRGVPKEEIQGAEGAEENRFTRLYREIVRRNATTVAAWQAYGFMNGVLNTDNTSIMGLSLDYGPFAFMDNFDPQYTPNHDDQLLRYSYKNQPSVIWWNLVRLGETLGELMGAGDHVDDEIFVSKGVTEEFGQVLVKRAETLIEKTGEEFKTLFLNEYKRLMSARLGLKTSKESDFQVLFSEMLDTLEALELDFNHFFRLLSGFSIADIESDEKRKAIASVFFHDEGVGGIGNTEDSARERIAKWLASWRERVLEDWGAEGDVERQKSMKAVNPKFLPRSWVLDEVIQRVEHKDDRSILDRVMNMALHPFQDEWNVNKEEEDRFCGDVPRFKRATISVIMDDEDEVLRQALEESLRLHETHQRSIRRRQNHVGELEREALRESEVTAAAAAAARQDSEDDETDMLMQVMRQSIADEEARAERRRRDLEELHRIETRFGSRNSAARASTSSRGQDDARPRSERILHDRPLREEPEEYDSDSTRERMGLLRQRQRPSNSRTGRSFHGARSDVTTRANSLGIGGRGPGRRLTSGESFRSSAQRHHPRQRMSEDEGRPNIRSYPPRQRTFGGSRAPRETASSRHGTLPLRPSRRVSPPGSSDDSISTSASDDNSTSSDDDSTNSDDDYDDDDDRRIPPHLIRRQRVPSPRPPPGRPPSRRPPQRVPSPRPPPGRPPSRRPPQRVPSPRPPPQRARTTRSPSPPRQQRRRTTNALRPRPAPADYDEEEILARSRREAFPTGPFTEEGEEFNHHQLQSAINESAGQGRDEDEEAIERNRGVPTYEEACAMERYKAPHGKKYVFQGPSSVTLEGENGNPGVTMKVTGDMDLGVALKIANGGTNSQLGRSVGK